MTRRMAVTGTDGTGKTTVIRLLRARYASRPDLVRAFRAPQYHEDGDLPFDHLSAVIEATSQHADRTGDLPLKAIALFLSMTLYGDVERHVASAWAPAWVVAERQCVCDSLVYARFYRPVVQRPLDEAAVRPGLAASLEALGGDRAVAALEGWVRVVAARAGASVTLWDLGPLVYEIFGLPQPELVARLMRVYHAQVPDRIVVLTAQPDVLAQRLAAKSGKAPRELHEQLHVVTMFQEGLKQAAAGLQASKPSLRVDLWDTSAMDPDAVADALAAELEA